MSKLSASPMEIDFLRHFGLSSEAISILKQAHGEHLLPLQQRAIRDEKLLEGQSLLITAPTSSGKTFLTEILFLYHVSQGRNVFLLAPTKALANQRYLQWRARYQALGYQICLSTRDHPGDDPAIREGRFHLAIVIYEKMRALAAQDDRFLVHAGALLIDEFHYVFDPQRGPLLELLLTQLRRYSHLQMLGLTTMRLEDSLAQWLQAQRLIEDHRPAPLRQGVLHGNQFTYRDFNSAEWGQETLAIETEDDEGLFMLNAARHFAKAGQSTLLFWPTREACYQAAARLAETYQPSQSFANQTLEALDPTTIRKRLQDWLARGIAVHTSDLTLQERQIVEQAVANQEVLIICATATLSEGVNFPVDHVLTLPRMVGQRPEDIQQRRAPGPLPLPPGRLWNMIGRAGRYGFSNPENPARGMIVTTARGDVEGLLNTYLNPPPPDNASRLMQLPWTQLVLATAAAIPVFTRDDAQAYLSATLCGIQKRFPADWRHNLEHALREAARQNLLAESEGRFSLTPLGGLVITSGLSIDSALRMQKFVAVDQLHAPNPLVLLLMIALLPEMEENYVPLSQRDFQLHTYTKGLDQRARENGAIEHSLVESFLRNPAALTKRHHESAKKALLLDQWIEGADIPHLENTFRLYYGAIQRLGEEAAWLLRCLTDAASANALPAETIQAVGVLQERCLVGLPQKALNWAPLIRSRTLSRTQALRFFSLGYNAPAQLRKDDLPALRGAFPEALLKQIYQQYKSKQPPAERLAADYIIRFDLDAPQKIYVNKKPVLLTPTEMMMLIILAQAPRKCVPYAQIVEAIWPHHSNPENRRATTKKRLLQKMGRSLGFYPDNIIEVVERVGYTLQADVHGPVPPLETYAQG